MIFSSLKAKLYAGAAIAFAGLLAIVKFLAKKNSRLERDIETKQAEIHRRQVVAENDNEVDEHEQQVTQDIRNDAVSNNPNEWLWKDRRSD